MKSASERIYLQIEVDGSDYGYTWCDDMINESDVEYIRIDLYKDMLATAETEIAELNARLSTAQKTLDELMTDCEGR